MKTIPLTQGKVALVDDEDYEFLINMGSWFAHFNGHNWYANITVSKKSVSMHRVIMEKHNPGFKEEIDHIDMDGFNNQYSNLRVATRSQNNANRGLQKNNASGYKGVCWCQYHQKWKAFIKVSGILSNLGYFNTAREAALAYDNAARNAFGPFARLNFPREGERGI